MPQYRAYITARQYRAFEFEADNDELAWDHIEKLVGDHQHGGIDRFLAMADESGPDELYIDQVEEI